MYATHEFRAEREKLNSFVLIQGERDEVKQISVGKVLLLFRCVVEGMEEAVKRLSYSL